MFGIRRIVLDFEARLTPLGPATQWPKARGKAEWERFGDGGEELDVDVYRMQLPDATVLDVYIERQLVGQITLRNGYGTLKLESRFHHAVPAATDGDVMLITHDGEPLLTGTFIPD